jgi:large subunit ribosomal protein L22
MRYRTILHYARTTPRKTRLVADLIRYKTVAEAQKILQFTPKRAAYFLYKVVNSALSNAINKDPNISSENLIINEVKVGDGPAFKRLRYGSMGRATTVKKRTSHIEIILENK